MDMQEAGKCRFTFLMHNCMRMYFACVCTNMTRRVLVVALWLLIWVPYTRLHVQHVFSVQ